MRLTPRMVSLATACLLAALFLTVGCSSRKNVPSADIEPPPADNTPQETTTTPPPPPSSDTGDEDTGKSAGLADAFFDYDEAALREDAKAALESNAKWLEKNTATKVVVEGHCDERGSVEYNLALGERRAKAAKEFLVSYGIQTGRLTTISYGKERPFDPGHNENSWAQNRRAHFVAK